MAALAPSAPPLLPQALPVQGVPVQGVPVQAVPVRPTAVQAVPVPAPTRVEVSFAGAPLVQSEGGEKREYSFVLTVAGTSIHRIVGRFSDLRKKCKPVFGEFPSRHAGRDFTKDEAHVAKRGEELRRLFELQLNTNDEGRVVGAPRIHEALAVTSQEAIQALVSVAANRRNAADAARAQEAARLAAIRQQELDDCRHAQEFNNIMAYANLAPGQLSTIAFPRLMRFELRNRWWGWGDANIRGPGGHPWFRMERTNPSMFGEMFKNCQFCICTLRGEPLLLLQENFRWMSYEYELYRIDPRTRQHIPVCRILREWGNNFLTITDNYDVLLHAAAAAHGSVQCSGRWPNQFTLHLNGNPVSTVDKEMFTFTDQYHVTLAPNTDVLLFLGIACAIDRIHHEIEDSRR